MSEGKPDNAEAGIKYEGWEVNLKPVLYFLFYLTLATVLVAALMYAMFWYMEDRAKAQDAAALRDDPLASERQVIPPEPRLQLAPNEPGQKSPDLLQAHPLVELKTLKEEDQTKLDSYGWVDESAGTVHLPIDRAKEMVIERSLFVSRPEGGRPPAQTKEQTGEAAPTGNRQ